MTTADRPRPVRHWLHFPLWVGAAAVALASALFVDDIASSRRNDRTYDAGHRVVGEIDRDWDGGRDVPLSYRHPVTGEEIHTGTYVWDTRRRPGKPGQVELEVSRDNPADVVLAGDRYTATFNLSSYVPWVVLPFVVWLVRRRTVTRTERLMASDAPTYAMTAVVGPRPWWARRWHLQLHPLDTAATSTSVCTVPLITAPVHKGPFGVEVKGAPRPYGHVVARDEGGEVLWPSGRTLSRVAPASAPRATRWLLWGGVALFAVGVVMANRGDSAVDVRERSRTITAAVVASRDLSEGRHALDVAYTLDGESYLGTVVDFHPRAAGEPLTFRVDPEAPTRVWSLFEDVPPDTDDSTLGGLAIIVGAGAAVAGVIARRRIDPTT